MLSKNKIKFVNSLKNKKYRDIYDTFIVEGEKNIYELFNSNFQFDEIYALKSWQSPQKIEQDKLNIITENELAKISQQKTPNQVLAVVKKPLINIDSIDLHSQLSLVLDDIRDPGNLGTIIRMADWFGINNIICSDTSVDVYNPKVVQSTMGSIFRINVFYSDLKVLFSKMNNDGNMPIYGTYLEGENIYKTKLSENGMIMFGNESNGISPELSKFITQKINIPSYSQQSSESLNISMAAAIICAEFRRRII